MYPLNDKDLDRLSRDAAEQFDVEPSASGWEQLESRLNKELPVEGGKDRRRFIFWIFLAALLSGGALTGMLLKNRTPETIAQYKTTNTPSVTDKAAIDVKESPATDNNKNTEKVATTESAVKPSAKTADKSTKPAIASTDIKEPETIVTKEPAKKKSVVSLKQPAIYKAPVVKNDPGSPRPNRRQKIVTPKEEVVVADMMASNNGQKQKETGNNTNKKVTAADDKKVNEPVTPVTADPTNTVTDKKQEAPVTKDLAKKEEVQQPAATKEMAKKKTPLSLKQPLEIGLTAGPDFTTVNFRQNYKTGINAGLTLGYRFNNRWSVNTGFIYTKKNYTAVGDDFHSPKHYWISYVDLHKVQGNCSMWEIPLNVRYDFSERYNNRFFVSTGLSTYLMNHEYYDYYYRYQGTEGKAPWSTDSARHYIASVLNLSIGYEHAMSKVFSLQVEPYLKVPLKGLGFGSMNMDSYGMYFTLKYKPVWGKKTEVGSKK